MKKRSLYEILGVKKTASKEEIKKAHRKKSKIHHPDNGGDVEKFKEVDQAYKILSNDASRARYDAGEDAEDVKPSVETQEMRAEAILMEMFVIIVDYSDNPETDDIVAVIKKNLQQNIVEAFTALNIKKRKQAKFEIVIKKLRSKGRRNFFKELAEAQIVSLARSIIGAQNQLDDLQLALKIIDDFVYDFDRDREDLEISDHNPKKHLRLDW